MTTYKPLQLENYFFHMNEENGFFLATSEKNSVSNLFQTEIDFVKKLESYNLHSISKVNGIQQDYSVDYDYWALKSVYYLQGLLLTITGMSDNKKFRDKNAKPTWCKNFQGELKGTDSGLLTIQFLGISQDYDRLEKILKNN